MITLRPRHNKTQNNTNQCHEYATVEKEESQERIKNVFINYWSRRMELNPVYTYISQYILLSVSVGWELSKYCIGTVCAQDSMRACVCVCVCHTTHHTENISTYSLLDSPSAWPPNLKIGRASCRERV